MAIQQSKSFVSSSIQKLLKQSTDDKFDILAVMGIGYNPATDSADRTVNVDAVDIRFDENDLLPNYIGINSSNSAATSDTTWVVYKYTYSDENATRIQRATGSWDGRAALF